MDRAGGARALDNALGFWIDWDIPNMIITISHYLLLFKVSILQCQHTFSNRPTYQSMSFRLDFVRFTSYS